MNSKEKYIEKWDMSVPRLGLGLNRLARIKDECEQERVIGLCMEQGVTYFEVAYAYAGSEELLNRFVVSKYPRGEYLIADKFPQLHLSPFYDLADYDKELFLSIAEKIFKEQLAKTGLKYFDFYLLHHVQKQTVDELERCGVFVFLDRLKDRGLVKSVGFSSHADIYSNMRLHSMYDWDFVQLAINFFDWESQGIKAQYEFFSKKCVPINVMCPLAGGNLTKMGAEIINQHGFSSPSDFSLKWVMSLDNVAVTLSGMTSVNDVNANSQSVRVFSHLGEDGALIADKIRSLITKLVPCTNCQYCLSVCPEMINIPRVFSLNNQFDSFDLYGANSFQVVYARMLPETGASKCKSCGLCSKICPNHIDIPALLNKFNQEAKNSNQVSSSSESDTIVRLLRDREPILIFGAGEHGIFLKRKLTHLGLEIIAFVDNDPNKWGTIIENTEVISFEQLIDKFSDRKVIVAVINKEFSKAIKKQCCDAGVEAVMC